MSAAHASRALPVLIRPRELLGICRAAGMRMLGPNCLGALNTTVGLNATFAPQPSPSGVNAVGLRASGRVGAGVPMPAFEDAVREFGPDHLLIALRRADRAAWPEQRLLEGLLARYDLPLTVFTSGDWRGR